MRRRLWLGLGLGFPNPNPNPYLILALALALALTLTRVINSAAASAGYPPWASGLSPLDAPPGRPVASSPSRPLTASRSKAELLHEAEMLKVLGLGVGG